MTAPLHPEIPMVSGEVWRGLDGDGDLYAISIKPDIIVLGASVVDAWMWDHGRRAWVSARSNDAFVYETCIMALFGPKPPKGTEESKPPGGVPCSHLHTTERFRGHEVSRDCDDCGALVEGPRYIGQMVAP